jgi:2-succinyl-6-hydroxy-2,4-cyclohexadiene-1-carboxylate synthase
VRLIGIIARVTDARPVVFVPGFMQRGSAFQGIAALLGERYPTVCIDHGAHTASERIEEIRTQAGPGSALVGYSMGGRLALHAALREPGRYRALVLIGTSAGIEDASERERRHRADEHLAAWMETQAIEGIVSRWERQPIFETQSPELVADQRSGRLAHDPAELATLLRSAGQGVMEPVWNELPRLRLPVLALAGENDTRYVAAARRIAEAVPNGRHLAIRGAGHAAQLERPDAVAAALVEFLDRLGVDGPADVP